MDTLNVLVNLSLEIMALNVAENFKTVTLAYKMLTFEF